MKQSAGILLYRKSKTGFEVLLVHPGGPFWAKKDDGSWSIPKGEPNEGEDLFTAAQREFAEELGMEAPRAEYSPLGPIKQSSKVVHAWVAESNLDVARIVSNKTTLEWPPRSGQQIEIPEVDKATWFTLDKARTKLIRGQVDLLDQLSKILGVKPKDNVVKRQVSDQISLF